MVPFTAERCYSSHGLFTCSILIYESSIGSVRRTYDRTPLLGSKLAFVERCI